MKIPEIALIPRPASADASSILGFTWADDDVGKRHKLGGKPQWIAKEEWPVCRQCTGPMTFYGQLDSIGDEVTLADCGIIYVFVCFACFETVSILQSA